jgi:asparagine synthase (glutamine-hydrolysing)
LHLPFEYKSNRDFRHKAILKQLLVKLAPHYDIHKPKRGFSFPLEKWLRGSWKERVCDSVSKNTLQRLGLEPEPYLEIVDKFYRKGTSHYTDVWRLYNLALWSKNFEENYSSVHNEKIYHPHH